MEIVLGGCRGGWHPDDGFVKIPSGVTLYLFQDPGDALVASVGAGGELDSKELREWGQSSYSSKLETPDVVPDYVTTDLDPNLRAKFFEGDRLPNVVMVGGGMHLSQVLAQSAGNIYWFSCQSFEKEPDPEAYQRAVAEGTVKGA